jgi:hypothetical protein
VALQKKLHRITRLLLGSREKLIDQLELKWIGEEGKQR